MNGEPIFSAVYMSTDTEGRSTLMQVERGTRTTLLEFSEEDIHGTAVKGVDEMVDAFQRRRAGDYTPEDSRLVHQSLQNAVRRYGNSGSNQLEPNEVIGGHIAPEALERRRRNEAWLKKVSGVRNFIADTVLAASKSLNTLAQEIGSEKVELKATKSRFEDYPARRFVAGLNAFAVLVGTAIPVVEQEEPQHIVASSTEEFQNELGAPFTSAEEEYIAPLLPPLRESVLPVDNGQATIEASPTENRDITESKSVPATEAPRVLETIEPAELPEPPQISETPKSDEVTTTAEVAEVKAEFNIEKQVGALWAHVEAMLPVARHEYGQPGFAVHDTAKLDEKLVIPAFLAASTILTGASIDYLSQESYVDEDGDEQKLQGLAAMAPDTTEWYLKRSGYDLSKLETVSDLPENEQRRAVRHLYIAAGLAEANHLLLQVSPHVIEGRDLSSMELAERHELLAEWVEGYVRAKLGGTNEGYVNARAESARKVFLDMIRAEQSGNNYSQEMFRDYKERKDIKQLADKEGDVFLENPNNFNPSAFIEESRS